MLSLLQTSNIIIPNSELRARFLITLESIGLFGIGVFGGVALEAAYRHGEDWLEQVLDYLEKNLQYLGNYLSHHIPEIRLISRRNAPGLAGLPPRLQSRIEADVCGRCACSPGGWSCLRPGRRGLSTDEYCLPALDIG
jgi:hypothetical protein